MRKLYGAKWINYEKQLSEGDIIFDERHINGLWAMPYDMFLKCFNEKCKANYGDKFFILKTVPECHYLFDNKEIIGDRFKVVAKSTLELSNGYMNILQLYDELQKKSASEISSIKIECSNYQKESKHLMSWIKQLKNSNTKLRWLSRFWVFIMVGLLFYLHIKKII